MRAATRSLPVIASCDDCGACCMVVTTPPFRRGPDGDGEDTWVRLRWERPDLLDVLVAAEQARKASGTASFGTPCLWYDADARRCRHYEHRPRACREFAVGGEDCRDARRRAGIESSSTARRG